MNFWAPSGDEQVNDPTKTEYLDCPKCGQNAIPGTWNRQQACWWWTEDMTAKCPGCGVLVGVRVDNNGCDDEYLVASLYVVEDS